MVKLRKAFKVPLSLRQGDTEHGVLRFYLSLQSFLSDWCTYKKESRLIAAFFLFSNKSV